MEEYLTKTQLLSGLQNLRQQLTTFSEELTHITIEPISLEEKSKAQLLIEVDELRHQLMTLSKEKNHLEIALETITDHADVFEDQLVELHNTLELEVARRTLELKEKNILLQQEIQERQRIEVALRRAKNSAEQARIAAETANRAKSTFLAKMSHELRTPLNAIIGYSDILMEEAEDLGCQEIIPDLAKIQTAGQQLLAIISDILDISRIEAEKVELKIVEISLHDLIKEVVTVIEPILDGNQLHINCPPEIDTLCTDAMKVQQILQNLLNNAAKFTHQGVITLNIGCSGEWIIFEVIDNGIGIPADQLSEIFKPFNQADNSTTREYGGTGLGLTICERYCQMLGGHISVSSEEKKGSIFTVQLPLH